MCGVVARARARVLARLLVRCFNPAANASWTWLGPSLYKSNVHPMHQRVHLLPVQFPQLAACVENPPANVGSSFVCSVLLPQSAGGRACLLWTHRPPGKADVRRAGNKDLDAAKLEVSTPRGRIPGGATGLWVKTNGIPFRGRAQPNVG